MGIVIGSTVKGLIVGALVGWYASRVHSLAKGMLVGLLVSAFFAFLIAAMPNEQGGHYWLEIMIPGSIVGLIVGYATQTFGRTRPNASRRRRTSTGVDWRGHGPCRMIVTRRLTLVPASVALARAELHDRAAFADLLGAVVPEAWPPETVVDALPLFLGWLEAAPDRVGWFGWYALLPRHAAPRALVLVGGGGFLGPPQDGVVQMGYSVLPEFQRRGYATEMVRGLATWAFVQPDVDAHRGRDRMGQPGLGPRARAQRFPAGRRGQRSRRRPVRAAGDAAGDRRPRRRMILNHLNLAVTDVPAARRFLETYFGLQAHTNPYTGEADRAPAIIRASSCSSTIAAWS